MSNFDIDSLVVVPEDAGSVVQLANVDRPRDEVDLILDDMFGDVDDGGAGITDALLIGCGTVAVIATQVATLPAVVFVGGIAGIGLGSVLPIRSGIRRVQHKRRDHKIRSMIEQGQLLDTGHPLVAELVSAHQHILDAAGGLGEVQSLRSRNVAHGLLMEVATLLDGHRLEADIEIEYATARLAAMKDLRTVISQVSGASGAIQRHAEVAARLEIEASANDSALHQFQELASDLLGETDV